MLKHAIILTLVLAFQGAVDADQEDAHATLIKRVKSAQTLRVLFVGNSYSFKIPKQFQKVATDEGKRVHVEQVTKGGWTLKKHAASEATIQKIKNGKWDVVVLQEQSQVPSFPEKQRASQMDVSVKKLAKIVRESGALPVFFLTWGRKHGDKKNAAMFPNDTRDAMQQRLNRGYAQAAAQAGGAYIVPVGKIWSSTMKEKPETPLYTGDGSHPAKLGNMLGACVFYTAFYNETVKLTDKQAETFLRLLDGIKLKPSP